MKITLSDRKAVGAFLKKADFQGRVVYSESSELRATWGKKPLIAKWDKKGKLVIIPSDDRGVKQVQGLLIIKGE